MQEQAMIGTNLNFGQALELLKAGHRIARAGWNGKGMWLSLIGADEYEVESYQYFNATRLLPYIAMRTADAGLVPWLASQTDMLAEDWQGVRYGRSAAADHCEHAANALAAAEAPAIPLLDVVVHEQEVQA